MQKKVDIYYAISISGKYVNTRLAINIISIIVWC